MANEKYRYKDGDISCHYTITYEPKQSDFFMHAHDRFEIYFFISGCASYLVEGTKYALKSGDIMIMRPSETHMLLLLDESEPYERMTLNFSPSLIEQKELLVPFFDRRLGERNRYGKENFRSDFYKSCIENMYSDTGSSVGDRTKIISLLMPFLVELKIAFDGIPEGNTAKNSQFGEIIEYVNRHLFDDISLKGISEKFYVSMTHINRQFGKMTGSSLWNYVKIKRLLAAREEIRSGINATAAARKCGYGDYSAFYRAYVARFGVSPTNDR